jgi:hypothetical protein
VSYEPCGDSKAAARLARGRRDAETAASSRSSRAGGDAGDGSRGGSDTDDEDGDIFYPAAATLAAAVDAMPDTAAAGPRRARSYLIDQGGKIT